MSNEKEWLVSPATCKGCKYFGHLASTGGLGGTRCCNYTYITGKIRKNPPKTCEVKEKGRRARVPYSTAGVVVHRPKKNLSKPYIHAPI